MLLVYLVGRYYSVNRVFLGHTELLDFSPLMAFLTMYIYQVFVEDQITRFIHLSFKQVKETEHLWFSCLHKLQCGVIIQKIDEQKYIFQNDRIDELMGSGNRVENLLETQVKLLQNIEERD